MSRAKNIQDQRLNPIAFGAISGLLSVLGSSFPLLSVFAALPLFWTGLRDGLNAAVQACVVAFLLAAAGLFFLFPERVGIALTYLLLWEIVPVAIFVRQALLWRTREGNDTGIDWYPTGLLIATLTLYGLGLLALVYAFPELRLSFNLEALQAQGDRPEIQQVIALYKAMTAYLPGLTVMPWMLGKLLIGALAQLILVKRSENMRPPPSLTEAELPGWMLVTLSAAGLISFAIGSSNIGLIAQNIAIVLLVPFILNGIGTIHLWCRSKTNGPLLIGLFYFMFIPIGWPLALITLTLGIFEPWLKLRNRVVEAKTEKDNRRD